MHFFTTKERVKPIGDDDEKLSVKTVFSMLFKCRSWVLGMFYIICYGVINTADGCITYYATYVLGSTAAATAIRRPTLSHRSVRRFLFRLSTALWGTRKPCSLPPRCSFLARSGS